MKTYRILLFLAASTLLGSCGRTYDEYVYRGYLYSDSTLTSPLAGDTLAFYQSYGRYLGQSITDTLGRWAFLWVENFDNPYQNKMKMDVEPPLLLIRHKGDTLYFNHASFSNLLTLYPGCWSTRNHPYYPYNKEGGAE